MAKRVGVLTGGGDCPGLNAVIRGLMYKATKKYGWEVQGLRYGWKGAVEGITMDINLENTEDIVREGGTVLKSSRTNPYKIDGGVDAVVETMKNLKLDALVAIGGEDTCGVASKPPSFGQPKTSDSLRSSSSISSKNSLSFTQNRNALSF